MSSHGFGLAAGPWPVAALLALAVALLLAPRRGPHRLLPRLALLLAVLGTVALIAAVLLP